MAIMAYMALIAASPHCRFHVSAVAGKGKEPQVLCAGRQDVFFLGHVGFARCRANPHMFDEAGWST